MASSSANPTSTWAIKRRTFTQTGGTNSISQVFALGSFGVAAHTTLTAVCSSSRLRGLKLRNGGVQLRRRNASSQCRHVHLTLPMTLTGSGGNANLNTAGYAVSLSGRFIRPRRTHKLDSGTLTLAATNTYSGNTLISGGTLALGSSLALQNSTLDTSGSGVLSFGSLTAATLGGLTGPGTLAWPMPRPPPWPSAWATTTPAPRSPACSKARGSLIKIGSGTLALSGSNTYTGPTTISQGKLVVDGWLTNSAVSVNGGTLGGTGNLSERHGQRRRAPGSRRPQHRLAHPRRQHWTLKAANSTSLARAVPLPACRSRAT